MNRRAGRNEELAQFLRAMRARLRPEDVGLPDRERRRTPGLRRQEVAQLAAVSVEWYVRLEQGRASAPGAAVLDALARALRLSPVEHRHLHLIARGEAPVSRPVSLPVNKSLRVMMDGMPLLPAYLVDFRFDVLAHNSAAAALFGEDFGSGDADNVARMLFLPSHMREMQRDWARVAQEAVGNLRATFARHPDEPRLLEVIRELRSASPEFAVWWDDHTIGERAHGTKRISHPSVGELTVHYDTLATLDGAGQSLIVLTPADTAAEKCLRVLMVDRAGALGGPGLHALPAQHRHLEVPGGGARPESAPRSG
ncbi:helix-turn-helix transcriptional regulator [Streptomyces sp. NBC_01216]|uniref:helix-turn-helix transcriptional regulator n=1 Tax=Streptomyces sp. NBC_01216 TaxID=2903778 RepID=UPI002E1295B6|nr:helix-turn-helix transcriptional regulator [Streptomyces sp. NBC_01216]